MTARRSAPTANRNFALHGGNTEAWNYRPKAGGELVVYGGAGTGKTVGNLLRLLDYGDTYPGSCGFRSSARPG